MAIFILNKNLKPVTSSECPVTRDIFIEKQTDRTIRQKINRDYITGVETTEQSTFYTGDTTLQDGLSYHQNYMEYLEKCWGQHLGVVLRPDDIWYTLLCELVGVVSSCSEKYRKLFSISEQKKEICVFTNSLTVLPLDSIMEELKKLVPNNFVDEFLPSFSTTTLSARWARYAVFADLVSPYYDYSMKVCGIPSIDVRGTKDDWLTIRACWIRICGIMDIINSHTRYFSKVCDILKNIYESFNNENSNEFLGDIFSLKRCGSGSQTEVDGWWKDLFIKEPKIKYVKNYPSGVSQVNYKNLSTGKNYLMKNGLFQSALEGEFLVPEYAYVVLEKRDLTKVEKPFKIKFNLKLP